MYNFAAKTDIERIDWMSALQSSMKTARSIHVKRERERERRGDGGNVKESVYKQLHMYSILHLNTSSQEEVWHL